MSRFQFTPGARQSWDHRVADNIGTHARFATGLLTWYERMVLAILIENQRILNEIAEDTEFNYHSLLSLIRRIFDPLYFSAWDWVSIQAHLFPKDLIYWEKGQKIASEPNISRTKLFKTKYKPHHTNLKQETEELFALADDIREEILTEIITDIRTNVGKTIECDYSPADFGEILRPISKKYNNMNALSSAANKWIITDLNTAEDLCEFGTLLPHSSGPIGHGKFGTYDGWDVYVEPFTHNEVILGCKDGLLGSGYCFAPYIPLVTLPSDATMFAQEKSFLMRYSKALRRDGRKYFTKVVFV